VTPSYRLDIRDTSGVLQAVVTDFTYLTYTRRVNEVGILQFGLSPSHPAIAFLTDKAEVEVWRRDSRNGVDWYRDFDGLVRTTEYAHDSNGQESFTCWCPSVHAMLGWAIVGYPANTANRSTFSAVAAETIMKTLVMRNLTASGTTGDGRVRTAPQPGITIEANAAGGTALTYACSWANVLEALQDLAKIGGGDFDLVQSGAAEWEFSFHAGQLGTDRSASVTFSLAHGNMDAPVYTYSRADERTVAVVGGQGEESSRTTAIRTGTNYNVTTNNIEAFVQASDRDSTGGLNAAGDARLDELEARPAFRFGIIETPATVYNKTFWLGDLATARYRDAVYTVKVKGVTISLTADGTETKSFEAETV
jgi:hypothetical protein